LLLLRSLVVGVDLLSGLIQNSLDFSGIGASGSQCQILLICLCAVGWKDDAVGLGVDGGLLNEPLALDVIKDRLVRIDRKGRVCGRYLGVCVLLLEEDDGFIPQVESSSCGIGLGSRVKRRVRLGNLALARVNLTQAGVGHADDLGLWLLGGGFQSQGLR